MEDIPHQGKSITEQTTNDTRYKRDVRDIPHQGRTRADHRQDRGLERPAVFQCLAAEATAIQEIASGQLRDLVVLLILIRHESFLKLGL